MKEGEAFHVYIDSEEVKEYNVWWIDEDEYWEQFDEAERNLKCIV